MAPSSFSTHRVRWPSDRGLAAEEGGAVAEDGLHVRAS